MATAYITQTNLDTLQLENIVEVGIAGSFVIFKFEDGTTVLEKDSSILKVQFNPGDEDETEDNSPTE